MTRREYKTRWQAEKRRRLREEDSVTVVLQLPGSVVRNLRAGKPYGWSFNQYLRRRLMIAFANGKPIPASAPPPAPPGPIASDPGAKFEVRMWQRSQVQGLLRERLS